MYLCKFSPTKYQNLFINMEKRELAEAGRLMKKIHKSVKLNSKKYISPVVLRQIYREFKEWRRVMHKNSENSEEESEIKSVYAFECDVLKYLLERCYWIHYGDSDVIAYLLSATYDIVNDLGKMFDYRDSNKFWLFGKNYRIKGNFFIKSTWAYSKLAGEMVKPVDYFMEHANRKKLLFGGLRFAEQYFASSRIAAQPESKSCLFLPPCSLSFQYPELLPKLLKYGLFVKATPQDADVGKLLTGVIGVYLNYPTHETGSCGDFAIKYTARIRTMGNCLLRAVHSVDPSILLKSQNRVDSQITNLVQELSRTGVFPKLATRLGGPQELQHLCRRKIRLLLYDSWKLPASIQKLPLPDLMKEYLNLEVG